MPTNPNREPVLSSPDEVTMQNLTAEQVEVARQQLLKLAEEYKQADTDRQQEILQKMDAIVKTQIRDYMVDGLDKGVANQVDTILAEIRIVIGNEHPGSWLSLMVDRLNKIAASQR